MRIETLAKRYSFSNSQILISLYSFHFSLINIYKNTGVPSSAVITPMGNSIGATNTRDNTSAKVNTMAPNTIEASKTYL